MKMPEKIDERLFAPCGMNCMACCRHCVSKRPCPGCFGGDGGKPEHCRKCGIRDCARERGLAYCFACPDYPCKPVKNLDRSYRKRYQASLMENGAAVKARGLEAFLAAQREEFTCPACGGAVSLHDAACSECGRPRPRGGLTPAGKRGGKGVQWVRPAAAEGECARMMLKILLIAACLGAVLLDAAKKLDLLGRWHMALCALLLPHALFWWQRLSRLGGAGLWAVRLAVGVYFAWTLLRLLFFPARDYQTENRRVRVLWAGRMALRGGLLLLLMQAVFYLWVLPPLAGGLPGWVVPADLAAAFLLVALVILGGALRILFTCRRLGIVKRVLLVLNLWIPVVNLFLMLWLCRAARDEYDHECYREEARRVRAERDVCRTRYPLLLVHGVGFRDLKYFNYWGRIPRELQRNGAAVYYGHQQAWGTIEDNAEAIRAKILEIQTETGCEKVNIIAHSKGGLDARYLITRLGMGEAVASLTTISTQHRGSELLDLLGKLPDGLYRKICGMVDAAFRKVGDRAPDACTASRQLAPAFAEAFNAETPDDPRVSYRSWATVMKNPLSDPLLSIPYFLLRCVRGPNDGLVCIDSAKWGTFGGVLSSRRRRGISHGDIIDLKREDYRGFDVIEWYVGLVSRLRDDGF